MTEAPFGAHLLTLSPQEGVVAEASRGKDATFIGLDELLTTLLRRSFTASKRLVDISYAGRSGTDTVTVLGLSDDGRTLVDDRYSLHGQEQRGAWFLPQTASLKLGFCNLPAHMAAYPRFAINAARDEVAKADFRISPDALFAWAVLLPLCDELLTPIDVRAPTGQLKSADQQAKQWATIDQSYACLGIDASSALAVMRPGGAWGGLRAAEQVSARQSLLKTIGSQISVDVAKRWRMGAIQSLATAYYSKAKSGPPLAATVLTKAHQHTLAAVFAGDWLAFVDYLGERPNAGERITTSLPEPRLYTAGAEKVGSVAASLNLPADEVERMLAAYMGAEAVVSPVNQRVRVMRRWWTEFDQLHAAQAPGRRSLWGLVDEGFLSLDNPAAPEPYVYRRLLPADLVEEVNQLWDGITLPRWPDRIVSEFHPHEQMAEAFGPAVAFWQGVALTCWYVCEGSSRTDVAGLARYHERQLRALDEMGHPVDRMLFQDLRRAENNLGRPRQVTTSEGRHQTSGGLIVSVNTERTRRDGFEYLREVVTHHRRLWSEDHLDRYLHSRWETDLRAVAREHSRRVAAGGKVPTLKQFASFAAPAANHWFGGDLGAVYAAVGEAAPARPKRIDLLPGDPLDFARDVYALLNTYNAAEEWQWELRKLAAGGLRYLQLWEALNRPPTAKEFGTERFHWDPLGGLEEGWVRYGDAVATSCRPRALDPVVIEPPPQLPAPPLDPSPAPGAAEEPLRRRNWLDRLRGRG